MTSYADDTTLTSSHPQVEKIRVMITPYLNTLHDWLESRKLNLSAENVFGVHNLEQGAQI